MAVQPMAMPVAAADPRPVRARPAQGGGDLRGTDLTARRGPEKNMAEEPDFADIHAALAPAVVVPAREPVPFRLDVAAISLPSSERAGGALTRDADVVPDVTEDIDSPEAAPMTVAVGDAIAAVPEAEAPAIERSPEIARTDMPDAAQTPRDLIAAPVFALGSASSVPEVPHAEVAAGPVRTVPADARQPTSAVTLPPATTVGTEAPPQHASPSDQPKVEAVAAAETTARRAEAALDRRAEPSALPNAPPAGVETAQAVRPAAPPVAIPQGPPQHGMAEVRMADGQISIAAEADRALADADALGLGIGAETRATTSFTVTTPVVDRTQGAAVMAQVAPTLRKGVDGTTEIRLDPPELGRVRLTLRTDENGLVATILAERPETIDMMKRAVDLLLRDLAAGGQTRVDLSFGSLGPEHGGGGEKGDDAPQIFIGLDKPGKVPGADLAAQLRLSRAAGGLDIRV